MEVFLGAKKARSPPALIWTDDGCSTAPDHPLDFNFADSCRRHDFGYRNYAAQGRLNDAARRRLDRNLWRDLLAECARIRRYNFLRRKRCRRTARFYYKAVRVASRRDKLHDKNKHQQHKHELTQQQQQQQQQQHQNQNQSQSQSQNQHKHLKQHQNQTKYHNSTSSSLLSNVNSTRLP
jgi:Sec-independent protein translocase protein TatA